MALLKGLLQHLGERFIGGLLLSFLISGIVGIVNACHPADENSSNSTPLEQLDTSGQ